MSIEITGKPRVNRGNSGLSSLNRKRRLDNFNVSFLDEFVIPSAWNEESRFRKYIWETKSKGFPRNERGQFTTRSTRGDCQWLDCIQTY